MSVHSEDILLFMKNCATHVQDALFLRKIEVDCIIEEDSDAFLQGLDSAGCRGYQFQFLHIYSQEACHVCMCLIM